ncbi:hypothetical protein RSAG8_05238, partial [Rhizoctonia solani AG-8 WAC10335]
MAYTPILKSYLIVLDPDRSYDVAMCILPIIKKPQNVSKCKLMETMGCGDGDEFDEPKGTYLDIQAKYRRNVDAITDGQALRYSDIPDLDRHNIHGSVLSSFVYLHRFPGNWVGKEMLRRNCRNKRDTLANKQGRKKGTRRGHNRTSNSGANGTNEGPKGEEQHQGEEPEGEEAQGEEPEGEEPEGEEPEGEGEEPEGKEAQGEAPGNEQPESKEPEVQEGPEGDDQPEGTDDSQVGKEPPIDAEPQANSENVDQAID